MKDPIYYIIFLSSARGFTTARQAMCPTWTAPPPKALQLVKPGAQRTVGRKQKSIPQTNSLNNYFNVTPMCIQMYNVIFRRIQRYEQEKIDHMP